MSTALHPDFMHPDFVELKLVARAQYNQVSSIFASFVRFRSAA